MTEDRINGYLEAGISRSMIEYIGTHDEIGVDYQEQLLETLEHNGMEALEACIEELIQKGLWEDDRDILSPREAAALDKALDIVMDLEEMPKESQLPMQYLNNAYIMRRLFYNQGENLLEGLSPSVADTVVHTAQRGQTYEVTLWQDTILPIDKNLEPFDFAVLDVIYSLYCNDIQVFTTKWIDMLLSGSKKRNPTANAIARIDGAIEKLAMTNVLLAVDGKERTATPLLAAERFGARQGYIYALVEINDLYAYAHDQNQIINVPASYMDTTSLPQEFAFADTETAIIIKRRVIARAMRILKINDSKAKLKNWNRISLIQKKDKAEGLFPELNLMPQLSGTDADEKISRQWRTKQKPLYVKIVRGTLENLKRQYVILDYQEHKDNDSKNPKDPVTGFDILCFTKSEQSALSKMREELKPQYVQRLLEQRKNQLSK